MAVFTSRRAALDAFRMTEARRRDNSEWPSWLHEAWNGPPNVVDSVWPASYPNSDGTDALVVGTPNGNTIVEWNGWIIRAEDGGLYTCSAEEFAQLWRLKPRALEVTRIHGVCWLLIRDGHVVLEACPKKAHVLGFARGTWFVPGGKVDGNETPEEALAREISEEWPVRLLRATPLPILEGSPVPPGSRGLFLMRPYLIDVDGRPRAENAEGVMLDWFPLEVALRSPVPQVRMMVAAAMGASL